MTIQIPLIFDTTPQKVVTTEDVREVIRSISDNFYGDILDNNTLVKLNTVIELKVNIVFGLKIKAEILKNNNRQLILVGYDDDSKAVLDPNCGIKTISTKTWRN